jgi:uncharacterized protein involved in exopolysaccharide biosynthesis
MLPGKKYSPEDLLRVAWKRRWVVAIPLVVIASTTAVVALFLPNRYRATTSVMIVPQRVPEKFVESTVKDDLGDRLNMISQQILSRTRLERIIQEFNLYPRERERLIMEDVIERMRKDISLQVNNNRRRDGASSFNVGFESPEARTAMRVTERLGSLFVQENLEDRALRADQTNQFLQGQLEEAKRRLQDHEKKLQEFPAAQQRPASRSGDVEPVDAAISTAAGSERGGIGKPRPRSPGATRTELLRSAGGGSTRFGARGRRGARAAQHVGAAARTVEGGTAGARTAVDAGAPGHSPRQTGDRRARGQGRGRSAEAADLPGQSGTDDHRGQERAGARRVDARGIQELRARIESSRREAVRLQEQGQQLAGRVQAAPGLESQLTELMRDYNTLQEGYTSLLKRSEDAKIAVRMEQRQIGEQFRILDGARLPERPVSPDRVAST